MKLSQETLAHAENCRVWENIPEFVNLVRGNRKVWSWGARGWTNHQNKIIAFRVSGLLFKGNVAIMVNGSDLMDIHFCSSHGNLKDKIEDVFIGDLITIIDEKVEKIASYAY